VTGGDIDVKSVRDATRLVGVTRLRWHVARICVDARGTQLARAIERRRTIMKELFIEELVTILGGTAAIDAREPPNLTHDVGGLGSGLGSSSPAGLNAIREDVGPPIGDPGMNPGPDPWNSLSGPGSHLAIHEGQIRGL
jgi:hypothetical protein